MTQTASTASDPAADRPLVRVRFPVATADATPLDGVALVTLERPDVLNALSFDLLDQLADALDVLDRDPACRAIVLTGSGDRAFAAGADIRELARQTPVSLLVEDRFAVWERIAAVRTPLIAAVRGFALGGGCELAMTCDLIIAGDDARFGQPEINLGVMPGAGGTQRLTRAIGKARAMDLILTGRTIDAAEAHALGLVTRLVPAGETVDQALELARTIAAQPPVAVLAAKEAVRLADELPLAAGLRHERRAFFALFATEDQTEGMAAFVEKRRPAWRGR
ncbi:MAG TPA: enoyl-CoA hydratase-related protein [Candidatus Limnocylindrales bacterium]|nr:enoyl-CoA hydratase-related protein [Candidatus Limnocylindrales bacterium]